MRLVHYTELSMLLEIYWHKTASLLCYEAFGSGIQTGHRADSLSLLCDIRTLGEKTWQLGWLRWLGLESSGRSSPWGWAPGESVMVMGGWGASENKCFRRSRLKVQGFWPHLGYYSILLPPRPHRATERDIGLSWWVSVRSQCRGGVELQKLLKMSFQKFVWPWCVFSLFFFLRFYF